jgi:glycosyltransferase involved in cell wall biosynthesis
MYLRDRPMVAYLLAKRGCDVLVLSSTYSESKISGKKTFNRWDKNVFPARVARCRTIKIRRVYHPPLILFFPIKIFLHKFDIIHAHSVGTFSSFLGALVRILRHNVRFVLVADLNPTACLRREKSIMYKHIMSLPLKVADAIIVFTNQEKDFLTRTGINGKKIHVIPNGIRYDDLSKIRKSPNPSEIVLGFLGKMQRVKGVHRLVEPISRIMNEYTKKVKVIFAGPSADTDYASGIMGRLSKFPNFEYWGPLQLDSVDRFFRKCDIVFVPSLSEGYPATPFEAMAAGKCVITSNIFPINKFIEHGESGFLIDNDDQFYEYTKYLLDHPQFILSLGENARKKVVSLSWKNVITKYLEVYLKTLELH